MNIYVPVIWNKQVMIYKAAGVALNYHNFIFLNMDMVSINYFFLQTAFNLENL